jgi:hypothetical protein
MDIIFNELSTDSITSRNQADIMMREMLAAYKSVCDYMRTGPIKIRFGYHFCDICLCVDAQNNGKKFTVADWVHCASKSEKDLLLSVFRYPYVTSEKEDENIEKEYCLHTFLYNNSTPCYGLSIAYLHDWPAISIASSNDWKKNEILIIKTQGNSNLIQVAAGNIYSTSCCDNEIIQALLNKYITTKLIQTTIHPKKKNVHIPKHHGYKILYKFSQELCQNEYIESIINSLPMNSKEDKFVIESKRDGIIHLRLHWTDEGFGIAVQSTGRNIRETNAIADIINRRFNR